MLRRARGNVRIQYWCRREATVLKRYYHSLQIFFLCIGRKPTTWPANNGLQIMSRKSIIRLSLRLRQIIDLLATEISRYYFIISAWAWLLGYFNLLLFERKVPCTRKVYAYVAGATNDNTGASNDCFLSNIWAGKFNIAQNFCLRTAKTF